MPPSPATDTLSLTAAVDALHGSGFPAALVRLIQQQVAFDCALLLGVGLRPVYLYDNLHHQRALLFDRYLTRHFSQDPFMQAQEQGLDTVEANLALGLPVDSRDYRAAAAMLQALGVRQVRLLSNNPRKLAALDAAGLEVVERVALATEAQADNRRYLDAKRTRLGHWLP